MKVPLLGQTTTYTCGPASLRAVLLYHRIAQDESELAHECGTLKDVGTRPEGLLIAAKGYFPKSYAKRRLGMTGLRRALDHDRPVIVLYLASTGRRHYAVVTGISGEWVHLNDPWDGGQLDRMVLPHFAERWKDRPQCPEYVKWGLVVVS